MTVHILCICISFPAGTGGKETNPLPARAGRRRQEFAGREAEDPGREDSVLRHQGFTGTRVATGPVQRARGRGHS